MNQNPQMGLGAPLLGWRSPGPVASAFLACRAAVQSLLGPYASGKTSTVAMKAIIMTLAQRPSLLDGWRKFKLCTVRDHYTRLWETTIPSFQHWFPEPACKWEGSTNGPAVMTARYPDYSAELICEFVAIGDHLVEDVLRGYEPTAFYLNEADRLSAEVYTNCRGRWGRYPKMADGGPDWYGILMDFNAPDVENYLYKLCVENKPADLAFFRQPSGLDPAAENLANLPEGQEYYRKMAEGQPDWWVRRFIHAEFGYSREGKPVYPEFSEARHVAKQVLTPAPGLAVTIGLDAGGTPAATLRQRMPNGQVRFLDELVAPPNAVMGPRAFGARLNQLLTERYRDCGKVMGWADPSAQYGADIDDDQLNWIQIVASVCKVPIFPAPTNAPSVRQESLRQLLIPTVDGREPAALISPNCRTLIRGLASGYHYRRKQVPGEFYEERVAKNHWSHVCEAAEYGELGGGDFATIMAREQQRRGPRQVEQVDEENPRGRYVSDDDEGADARFYQ